MNLEINNLLSLKEQEGELSYEDCRKLNKYLAEMDFASIHPDQYENIREYIDNNLLHNNVDSKYKGMLSNLYDEICDAQRE